MIDWDYLLYLFDQVNASLQVKTEVDHFPLNTLLLVLFLFQHKHVMVKELLQTLISVVNAELFETVELLKYLFLFILDLL